MLKSLNAIMIKKIFQIARELKYGENLSTRVNARNGLQTTNAV